MASIRMKRGALSVKPKYCINSRPRAAQPAQIFISVELLLLSLLLTACLGSKEPAPHTTTFVSGQPGAAGTPNQAITYSTLPQDVLIRTFTGGGLYGSLSLSPNVSIYGDGTYILGTTQEGQLGTDALQNLLHHLVDTYGLLDMQQRQFADIQDQNATYLELNLNGQQMEFMYGSFGNQQESALAMQEYHNLGLALTAINQALTGPTQPYHSQYMALLVRQDFSPNLSQSIPAWPITDFTLAQAAAFECGLIPQDTTSQNPETGCLKYTIPDNAILLTATQQATLVAQMPNQTQSDFSEDGLYYQVTLRPLLPDEIVSKELAMFGSAQQSYKGVPLLEGAVPPVPTPTPTS
jgi:hypothetical protein